MTPANGSPLLFICCVWVLLGSSLSTLVIPNLPPDVYTNEGDINIGALIPVHRYSDQGFCSPLTRELGALQRVETVVHTIAEINNRSDILPNVTLGYTIFDDCSKDTTGLAQITHFIQSAEKGNCCLSNAQECIRSDSVVPYDVVGIIGTESSSNSIGLAKLLGLFEIPQLSYISTSTLLSNKYRFPYFTRLVPPDSLQAQVMVDILVKYGWSFVSVLFAEGGYGTEGYKALRAAADRSTTRVCFAVIQELSLSFTDDDYDSVIERLLKVPNAKAVIMFTNLQIARSVLKAGMRKGVVGNFTFIGSDAWGRNLQDFNGVEDIARGSLTIKIISKNIPRFDNYFSNLTSDVGRSNPWFKEFWEDRFNCEIDSQNSSTRCADDLKFAAAYDYHRETTVSLVRDATYVYAHALHNLITENCPGVSGTEARKCVNGSVLLNSIRKLNFSGSLDQRIYFDNNQDGNVGYEIQNLVMNENDEYELRKVGYFDTGNNQLQIMKPVVFNPTILPDGDAVPVSICSKPCGDHEEQKQRLNDPPCCWTCQKCRPNEITYQDDFIKCAACPPRHKPSETNYSTCEPIVADYMKTDHPVFILLYVVTSLLLLITIFMLVFFLRYRKERLIKACNKELSYIMLSGILCSYLLPYVFLVKPQDGVCIVIYAGFHVTCTLMYGPLFIKTNRIYRIFESGQRTAKRPAAIDTKSQLLFASAVIILQVLVITIWAAVDRSLEAIEVEKEFPTIERICNIPLGSFITSLSYNILLVIISAYYAFKTRTLPHNFNESKFIAFCVYTTLVMWLAFVPAYFIVRQTIYANSVLCCAMMINATVTLMCIFCPKVYAIKYVKKEDMALASTLSGKKKRAETFLKAVSTFAHSSSKSNNNSNDIATIESNTTATTSRSTDEGLDEIHNESPSQVSNEVSDDGAVSTPWCTDLDPART